jgi:hypothetical protein
MTSCRAALSIISGHRDDFRLATAGELIQPITTAPIIAVVELPICRRVVRKVLRAVVTSVVTRSTTGCDYKADVNGADRRYCFGPGADISADWAGRQASC